MATDGAGGDAADRGASDAGVARVGPGPFGALPTGYCCASDADCRYRHCVEGTCVDECSNDAFCEADAVRFVCVRPDGGGFRGRCARAPGAHDACLPASSFTRGGKTLGACCARTGDGRGGWECEGALCTALGSGPLVCTNACVTGADCPGPFRCADLGTYRACIPANDPYVCR